MIQSPEPLLVLCLSFLCHRAVKAIYSYKVTFVVPTFMICTEFWVHNPDLPHQIYDELESVRGKMKKFPIRPPDAR